MVGRPSDRRVVENFNDDQAKTDTAITCNCTKSNCTKKYCECYKAGVGCHESCRCINCENGKQSVLKAKQTEIKNPKDFIIEGTSVFIYNEDIYITTRKVVPKKKEESLMDLVNITKPNILSPCPNIRDGLKASEGKKLFGVNLTEGNFTSTETPKLINKRKRVNTVTNSITNERQSSYAKASSTIFQTPVFTTSYKTSKKNVNMTIDRRIVKNLDTMY